MFPNVVTCASNQPTRIRGGLADARMGGKLVQVLIDAGWAHIRGALDPLVGICKTLALARLPDRKCLKHRANAGGSGARQDRVSSNAIPSQISLLNQGM